MGSADKGEILWKVFISTGSIWELEVLRQRLQSTSTSSSISSCFLLPVDRLALTLHSNDIVTLLNKSLSHLGLGLSHQVNLSFQLHNTFLNSLPPSSRLRPQSLRQPPAHTLSDVSGSQTERPGATGWHPMASYSNWAVTMLNSDFSVP